MIIKDKKTGKKMYPVGKWKTYQHVFYNYNDICYNEMYDNDHSEESIEKYEESEKFLEIFNSNVFDGMVYALYEDYKKMKDIIGAYVYRHNGYI